MDRKWSQKTTFEKILDIISGIALCVWLIFGVLERKHGYDWADKGGIISAGVICVCQAISFWSVKRVISYIAIGGAMCMVASIVIALL